MKPILTNQTFLQSAQLFSILILFLGLGAGCGPRKDNSNSTVTVIRKTSKKVQLPREGIFHDVRESETLYSICTLYGKSVKAIRLVNGLSEDSSLKIGQLLFIPGAKVKIVPKVSPAESLPTLFPYRGPKTTGAIWPVEGKVLTRYQGDDKGVSRDGMTISALPDSPVWAIQNGIVRHFSDHYFGYGKVILIEHGSELYSLYGHLSEIRVKMNQRVRKGDVIARAGSTGRAKRSQLYFRLSRGQSALNPEKYLGKRIN